MARGPVAGHAQAMVEPGVGLVGGRGRGRWWSAGRRGRAIGRGVSNIGRAPVSDHVAACRVPAAGDEPPDRRRGVSRCVPAAGHGAIPRSSGRGVHGHVPGRGADSSPAAAAIHVSVLGRAADPGHDATSMHRKFISAVNHLGIDSVPKRILELMNVEKLTRVDVASHLQVDHTIVIFLARITLYHVGPSWNS
ncbi:hypothetical protein ACQJBY_043118 [Aegilops geniculata]